VQYRQINGEFKRIDQLLEIEGIGDKKFQKLLHYFNTPKPEEKHGE